VKVRWRAVSQGDTEMMEMDQLNEEDSIVNLRKCEVLVQKCYV
jgi:hypothetical protein